MPDDTERPEELGTALRRLAQTLLRTGRNRRDLFLLEARDEWRQGCILLLAGGAALALTMAVVVGTATAVAWCLQAGRPDLLLGLAAVLLVAVLVAYVELRRRLRRWHPFSATLAELGKDVAS